MDGRCRVNVGDAGSYLQWMNCSSCDWRVTVDWINKHLSWPGARGQGKAGGEFAPSHKWNRMPLQPKHEWSSRQNMTPMDYCTPKREIVECRAQCFTDSQWGRGWSVWPSYRGPMALPSLPLNLPGGIAPVLCRLQLPRLNWLNWLYTQTVYSGLTLGHDSWAMSSPCDVIAWPLLLLLLTGSSLSALK